MEVGQELPGVGQRRDLGLHDDPLARQSGQYLAQLPFRGTVAAGGLDVVDAQVQGPPHRGFEVGLLVGGDIVQRRVLPLVLVAHPAAGEHGHRKSGSAKSSVEHRNFQG